MYAIYKPRFKVVFTNERIITSSGLGIIASMLGKSDFVKRCNRMPVDKKRSEPQIKNGDILLTYIGLLCQAKTSFDSVNEMKDDTEFYKDALGIVRSIPSAETLRQQKATQSLVPQRLQPLGEKEKTRNPLQRKVFGLFFVLSFTDSGIRNFGKAASIAKREHLVFSKKRFA